MILRKIPSRLLVIDASVAQAAGEISLHPVSRACREFLQDTLEICHRIAMTEPIRVEWNDHASRFARIWKLSMISKKKLVIIRDELLDDLRDKIFELNDTFENLTAMEKDILLVQAAMAADMRVISLDEKVRTLYSKHSDALSKLKNICWVNPCAAADDARSWLLDGAPTEKHRTLGYKNEI